MIAEDGAQPGRGMRDQAVFLDRDGVINHAIIRDGRSHPPASLEELTYLPHVPEAMRALREAGCRLIVVTNQPDVGQGLQRREVVEAIHADLRRRLPLDAIKVCFHIDRDGCACRKPKPGLLLEAAREWNLDLSRSVMVGDRWRDIEAGKAAGCKTIWIRSAYAERRVERPDAVVDSLAEASGLILSRWAQSVPAGGTPCRV